MSALRELDFFNADPATPRPHNTDLELTIPNNPAAEPDHDFKKIAHVIQPGDTLDIKLVRKGAPDAISHIASYCSTTTDSSKIRAISILVKQSDGSTSTIFDPPTPFPAGTFQVTFQLELEREEMILIGIILEVTRNGQTKHYLCDPQVGNGPP